MSFYTRRFGAAALLQSRRALGNPGRGRQQSARSLPACHVRGNTGGGAHGSEPWQVHQRAKSTTASNSVNVGKVLEFPGARMSFVSQLEVAPALPAQPMPCYRVLDDSGQLLPGASHAEVSEELALRMYRQMAALQAMDVVFYEAQRQGRFSFYMTTLGEEAVNIASAAALDDRDHVFAQYREPGVLLWRGFPLQQFANQCFGNEADLGKGRQMPVHYGSADHHFQTISSPLATQIPQAVGAAYALKTGGTQLCAVTYFGEGAASEGDFHAAMNFAAVLEAPVLLLCRNNGWAISTPSHEQYRGDGIAGRGQSYGVRSLRVDGNDALAVYSAVCEARRMAVEESRPVLIEAMTYRSGHHSTSDDSSRYRGGAEIAHWKTERDPVARFRRWLEARGWWGDERERALRKSVRAEVIAALDGAERMAKPPLTNLFTDVYDEVPANLREQEQWVREAVRSSPQEYPSDVPL